MKRIISLYLIMKDFFGAWPGTSEEAEKIKKELANERKRFKTREVKL